MDENSFAVYEKDWFKDKPMITGLMLQEVFLRTGERLIFKKDSPNTVKVTVLVITENGGYNCTVELIDDKSNALFEPKAVTCYKGGTFGTKLNLMKDGAKKIGATIGKALKTELKKI